ncbi:MAG: DUF2141 domain-containing protein [Gammaproteobacteria bacterium]|nr:DUF2141 domain-containing protein [Gammaproteobacteria bacterium]
MNLDRTIYRACRTAAGTIATATVVLVLGLSGLNAADAAEVAIVIDDVRSSDGVLRVQILSATADGREGEAVAGLVLPPALPQTRATLHDLESGRYLARVHHDLDGDGEMATNLVGMPQEPWGVSNDARGRFGPPLVVDMIVDVGADGGLLRMTLVH